MTNKSFTLSEDQLELLSYVGKYHVFDLHRLHRLTALFDGLAASRSHSK